MRSTLLEILSERDYCLAPSVFEGLRSQTLSNIDLRLMMQGEHETALQGHLSFKDGLMTSAPFSCASTFVGDAERIKNWKDLEPDDQIVNIVRLTGVMTRGGGECSYGSLELRDRMMRAADIKHTIGHIIYTRTPGGAADSLLDWRKAIDYCHAKGQKVYMYCDGEVASGGTFLSGMCDGVYFFNEKDEIGSLGLYRSCFILPDGAKNAITSETYHEYYASRSKEKNRWYRDAAVGNKNLMEDEVNAKLEGIISDYVADRPQVKDEQLEGAMYPMGSVIGTLVDGQCTLNELAQKINDDWAKGERYAPKPPTPKRVLPPIKKDEEKPKEDNDGDDEDESKCNPKKKDKSTNQQNNNSMSKQYVQIAAFLGDEAYASDKENSLTLQENQADSLEEKLPTLIAQNTQMASENTLLAQQLADMKAKFEAASQKSTELEAAVASGATALESAKAENATLTEAKKTAETKVAEQLGIIAANTQTIADRDATIVELNAHAGGAPNVGDSPKTNGASADAPHMEQAPEYDPMLSAGENAKNRNAYMDRIRKKAYGVK